MAASTRLITITAAALFAALSGSGARAQEKTIAVECANFPPACMEPTDVGPGFLVEAGAEAVARAGFKPEIRIVPWRRAQQDVMERQDAVIVYFARTPERVTSFQWIETTNETTYAFVTKEGTPPIDTLEQAKALETIAIPAGSNVRSWLLAHGIDAAKLQESALETSIATLHEGHVPVYFGATITYGPAYRRATGVAPVVGQEIYSDTNWVAAGLRFPKEDADRIGAALRAMKADGTITRLIAKYDGAG